MCVCVCVCVCGLNGQILDSSCYLWKSSQSLIAEKKSGHSMWRDLIFFFQANEIVDDGKIRAASIDGGVSNI